MLYVIIVAYNKICSCVYSHICYCYLHASNDESFINENYWEIKNKAIRSITSINYSYNYNYIHLLGTHIANKYIIFSKLVMFDKKTKDTGIFNIDRLMRKCNKSMALQGYRLYKETSVAL